MERLDSEGKGTDALKRDLDTLRRWQSKYDDEAALRAEYDRYYKGLYGVEFDDLDAVGKLAVKQRAQREMVARGFELYLREGEAPTPGMEAVFRRMGKWMKRVYASASQLDVEISDEVREVFDRWLASEEDIAAAAAARMGSGVSKSGSPMVSMAQSGVCRAKLVKTRIWLRFRVDKFWFNGIIGIVPPIFRRNQRLSKGSLPGN